MRCTFFGHRDTPSDILPTLKRLLCYIIEEKNARTFYVGNNGNFDRLVLSALRELKIQYPHIRYYTVLAYLPQSKDLYTQEGFAIFPEEAASAPPRFAVERRNGWMLDNSDFVVVYVKNGFGGAAKFKKLAERRGKSVYNVAVE